MPQIRQWLSKNATVGSGISYNQGDTPFASVQSVSVVSGGIRGPRIRCDNSPSFSQLEWNLPDDNYISGCIYLMMDKIPSNSSNPTYILNVGDVNAPSFALGVTHQGRIRITGTGSDVTDPVFEPNRRYRVEWQKDGDVCRVRVFAGDGKVHLTNANAGCLNNTPGKYVAGMLSNPGNGAVFWIEGLVVYDTAVWVGPQFNSNVPLQRWNGTTFKEGGVLRRWNGVTFKSGGTLRRWTGSGWSPSP